MSTMQVGDVDAEGYLTVILVVGNDGPCEG